jgi:uncharacterized protein YkwD
MKRLIALVAFLLVAATPLAQGEGPADETRETLRNEILRLINRDRAANALEPVTLDLDASVLADSYCRRQIRNGTTGHFTTDGQAPYMRYSFAGGNDGVSENAAAWSSDHTFSDRALYEMARTSHATMMGERAPDDGHRRTILDPHATHVGIGLAWEKGEFRVAQYFIRRYVTWSRPLPRSAGETELVTTSGQAVPGYRIEAITVHHEPLPETMPAHVANAIRGYRLPEKRREYLPRLPSFTQKRADGSLEHVSEEYSDGRRGDFYAARNGSFQFTVPFQDGPGVYTVVVWVNGNGSRVPIAASNISIRVDRRASGSGAGVTAAR